MAKKQLLYICFLINFYPSHPISINICDCARPKTRGLLDLTDPDYCTEHGSSSDMITAKQAVTYRIITKSTATLTFEGHTCSEWVQTKRIVGSFWIGSFDTTFFHTTRLVEPAECWNMVQSNKCAGNQMILTGKTSSFIQEPVGEGRWYATREYSVTNCLIQTINIKEDPETKQIITPF